MSKPVLFLAILVHCIVPGCGDEATLTDDIVAKVGDRIITLEDFVRRAELTPRTRIRSVNGHVGNRALLEMLMAEKLLAAAAAQQGLDIDQETMGKIRTIESQAVQRELYHDEVLRQVEIAEDEIQQALARLQKTIVVRYFSAATPEEAIRFNRLADETKSFEKALQQSLGEDAAEGYNTARVTWGKLPKDIEDIVYTMKPGEVSPILATGSGRLILKVVNIIVNPIWTESQTMQMRHSVTKTIRMRREDAYSAEYVQEFMAKNKVTIEGKGFALLSRELTDHINASDDSGRPEELRPLAVLSNLSQSASIRSNWDEPVVKSLHGTLTVADVIRLLHNNTFSSQKDDRADLQSQINGHLLTVIQDEQLALEGYRRGLQNRQSVKAEVRIWRDYFLYQKMLQKLALQPNDSADLVYSKALLALREQSRIQINTKQLALIELTQIPLLAVRPGRANQLAVPPWPLIL